MNYAELVSSITNYVETQFPTAIINTFIEQAEQRIYNTVQLPSLRKNVTGNLTARNKYLTIPNDWLSTFSLAIIKLDGTYSYLIDKDVNFIREAFPEPNFISVPEYYAQFDGNTFILGPTPDQSYGAELHYFYYPPSIVTAGTTWLGNEFDSALLYGSLLEAATYLKSEAEIIAVYQKRYEEALALLKMLGDGKNRQDSYRSGQVRDRVV
jgi:hypothetical protein